MEEERGSPKREEDEEEENLKVESEGLIEDAIDIILTISYYFIYRFSLAFTQPNLLTLSASDAVLSKNDVNT